MNNEIIKFFKKNYKKWDDVYSLAYFFVNKVYDWLIEIENKDDLFRIANSYIENNFNLYIEGKDKEMVFQKYAKNLYNYEIPSIIDIE